MTKAQIINRLRERGIIAHSVELIPLAGGAVAEHVYRFASADGRQHVVKETKPNESLILRVLAHLESGLVPRIHCPRLLAENLLVWDYIPPVTPGPLHPALARDYARFQNATDSGTVFAELGLAAKLDKSGHGFYTDSFHRCLREAETNMAKLAGLAWPVLRTVRDVVDAVGRAEDQLAERFGYTPFAWVHHDFRDENIVGNPPRLIDWGSSYGYGPYLYDIAPYLLESPDTLVVFRDESSIARARSTDEWREDLAACAAAALMGYLNWHLGDLLKGRDMARTRASLERRADQFGHMREMLACGVKQVR